MFRFNCPNIVVCFTLFTLVFLYFQISISFSHTIGTRVRLSLLRSVSKRQKEKDPNAVCSVSSFTPRPMLRVGGGKDKGTRFMSFVDAMSGFKHLLTQEDLDKAASMCQGLKGHLRSRFIVLSDDREPPPPPSKKRPFADHGEDSPRIKRAQNYSKRTPHTVQGGAPQPSTSVSQFSANHTPQTPQVQQVYVQQNQNVQAGQLIPNQQVYHQSNVLQPSLTNQQFYTAPPNVQTQPIPTPHQNPPIQQIVQSQVVVQAPVGQQTQVARSDPSIFSPSAFPPLASGPLLTQPSKVLVQGDGYQTVGKGGRRQSQRVPGVAGVVLRKQPSRDQNRGPGVPMEDQDPGLQDLNDSHSDSSFVDAPDI